MKSLWILLLVLCVPLLGAEDQFPTYQEAAFYHCNSGPQTSLAFQILKDYPLKGDETILDIGCGAGRITAHLAGRVAKVTGLDVSVGMIDFARLNYNSSLYPNLTFIQGDILKSRFSQQFDLIVCFSTLHWIPNLKGFLEKVYAALKPGGKILFTIPSTPSQAIQDFTADLKSQERWSKYFNPRKRYPPEMHQTLLQEVGFQEIQIENKPFPWSFQTKREIIDWYSAFSPFVRSLLPEERSLFQLDFVNTLLRYCPFDREGTLSFHENHLIIQAKK